MKRIVLGACLVGLTTLCSAQANTDVRDHLAVLTSQGVHSTYVTDSARIGTAFSQVVSVLHVPLENLPNVVMVFASEKAAEVDGMPASKVTVAKVSISDQHIYHVWVTGNPTDQKVVEGLIWALNREFDLKLPEKRIDQVRETVCGRLDHVVTVDALLNKQ